MNRVYCQKQQECHLHILIKFRFVTIIFIKPLRFVKAHKDVGKDRSQRRTHGYSINLIIKLIVKNKMSLRCSEKEKFFKFFSSDVQIRIMIEKEIYCYVNGFLKWNISKKTSYVIGNKKVFGKICILNTPCNRFYNNYVINICPRQL